jgi:glycosyltransferase involved in cell wall biosynthesis
LRCLKCAGQYYGPLKGTPITLGLRASRRRWGRVSLFLPISASVQEASLEGIPAQRIEQIPSFVDDTVFDEARNTPRPEFLPDGPFVLFVGALGEHKGLGLSVEAHQKMRTALPLVVIGSQRADTRGYTGSSDRAVVTHTAVPHEQIMASLAAAAVAVVPSRWQEPLGLVAIEAMAANTPVVATRVGALAEVVQHQRTGLVVPPNDSAALAAAIDELLGNRALARQYAAAGARRAREYTASAVIPRVLAAYDRAWSAKRAA